MFDRRRILTGMGSALALAGPGLVPRWPLAHRRTLNTRNREPEAERLPMKAKSAARDFPVVCVGGSAGGLDAYTRLLRHLPADMGVAVVIVNHLRTVATMLHEILSRYMKMPVELITEKLLIQPNRVFVIPAQRDLHVLAGEFRLKPISKPRGCQSRAGV